MPADGGEVIDEAGTGKQVWWAAPAAVIVIGVAVLSWRAHEVWPADAGLGCPSDAVQGPYRMEPGPVGHGRVTALGIGAAVLAAQLFLSRCAHRGVSGAFRVATGAIAVLTCVTLLLAGHQAPRTRSPRHESFEGLSLRDRPAAVLSLSGRTAAFGFRAPGRCHLDSIRPSRTRSSARALRAAAQESPSTSSACRR